MVKQPDVRYINAYVSGSVAYQLEKKPIRKAVKLPNQRKKKKVVVHVDPVSVLSIFTAAVLLAMLCVGFMKLQKAREETASLESYVHTLQAENMVLQNKYDSSYDLEEIREIALAMGMVPMEQLETVQISVPAIEKEVEQEPSGWEAFCTFLAGLFA